MAASPEQPSRTVVLKDASLRQFEGGFTSIPNRILENNDLSLGARMTYAMLLKYAWQKDFCFPAQQQLARDLGITDRSVRTFLGELRDRALIDWKQQGLNRPNIYYILKLPERVRRNDGGHSGPEDFSAPERNDDSGQERKQASDKEYPMKNTQNVNDVGERKPWRAADGTPRLTRDQFGKAEWLAKTISETIGQPENYRSYFKIAATAVRTGHASDTELIFQALGETKERMHDGSIRETPSQYFHGAVKRRRNQSSGAATSFAAPESVEGERASIRAAREAFLAHTSVPSANQRTKE
ncbi:MAG: helix-turn-helix domain-containing protein [Deltaproteobacteria bacterium]|nr:helix-turn-helix domain-containing protein [Deltaproteobacteria bacterium]MBI3388700.1 helix-turn-helix domain-containing protein [Deltaproteobacteria bacterium]